MSMTTSSPKQHTRASSTAAPSPTSSTIATTTLITEQQVRFSTAAAVALPPTRTRGFSDVVHEVAEKVRAMFANSEKSPAQRHYPKRNGWLENARMGREMYRL